MACARYLKQTEDRFAQSFLPRVGCTCNPLHEHTAMRHCHRGIVLLYQVWGSCSRCRCGQAVLHAYMCSPVTRDHASLTNRMFQFSESVLTSMMPSEKQSMAPMRPVVWLRNLSVSSFCAQTEGHLGSVSMPYIYYGSASMQHQSCDSDYVMNDLLALWGSWVYCL